MALISLDSEQIKSNKDLEDTELKLFINSILSPQLNVNRKFNLVTGFLVLLAIISLSSRISNSILILQSDLVIGGLILICMGLTLIGLRGHTFNSIIGLLTTLMGFEIIYANLEVSVMVAGLLAGVTLALAMIGSYLLLAPTMEES